MSRFLVMFFCCITFVAELPAYAGPLVSGKVALLSLHTEDAGKYTMLKDAVTQMLVAKVSSLSGIDCFKTHLSSKDEQLFVQGYPVDSKQYFEKLHADTIAIGYLQSKGENFSFQLRIYRDSGDRPQVLSAHAEAEQEVLPALDDLLAKIDISIFEKDTNGILGAMANSEEGMKAFLTDHPDKKYKKEMMIAAQHPENALPLPALHPVTEKIPGLAKDFSSMIVSDLDGDGHAELLAATKNSVAIYGYTQGALQKEQSLFLGEDVHIHALNVADVNKDGRDEIYVSATHGSHLSSCILSWEKTIGFKISMNKIPWAIRPLNTPGNGYIVAGQRVAAGTSSLEKVLWILDVDASARSVRAKAKLSMPLGVNLFDFVYADLDGDGKAEKVVVAGSCLAVFNEKNIMLWASGKGYADSINTIGGVADTSPSALAVVPVRLVTYDVDGDGGDEVFVVQNDVKMGAGAAGTWILGKADAICLKWESYTMKEVWRTEPVDGYLADIAVENDPETDGGRLFVAQKGSDTSVQSDDGKLLMYHFETAKPW